MKSGLKLTLLAGLLVAAGFAYSQSPMGGGQCDHAMMGQQGGMQRGGMRQMDPAKMQAMMDKRNAALKTQLKLTATQEAAWSDYTAAMKPPAGMTHQRPDMAEMAKLSTPERLDKMSAMRAQHVGDMTLAMDQHAQATKALYAVLTPEQRKVFDAASVPGRGKSHGAHAGKAMHQQPKL